MNLIQRRAGISVGHLVAAMFFLCFPIYGLLTGTLISIGKFRSETIYLETDPDKFWVFFTIYTFIFLVGAFLSKYHVPIIDEKMRGFRRKQDRTRPSFLRVVVVIFITVALVSSALFGVFWYAEL